MINMVLTTESRLFLILLVGVNCLMLTRRASVVADWSSWHDRDNQFMSGDWERYKDYNQPPCNSTPTQVQVRVRGSTTVILTADERIRVGPDYGLVCKNEDQPDNRTCRDYKVRYEVPNVSDLFDRDDPCDTGGDLELKELETGSEWKDGDFITWDVATQAKGKVDRMLEVGPSYGVLCLNKLQKSGVRCRDYEVRFFCCEP